jgi:5-methylcytosine-specific restriction endonuclease McrA
MVTRSKRTTRLIAFINMARRRKWRQGVACLYCKRTLEAPGSRSTAAFTRDHLQPRSQGGQRIVPACIACNHLKANKTPDEWRRFQALNPQWWKLYRKPEVF